MDASRIIEKIILDGHSIANKIKSAGSVSELEKMSDEIAKYSNLVDENFGILDDFDGRKDSELSTFLYVALDWAKKSHYPENKDNSATKQLAENFTQDFISFLDSKQWINQSYGQNVR